MIVSKESAKRFRLPSARYCWRGKSLQRGLGHHLRGTVEGARAGKSRLGKIGRYIDMAMHVWRGVWNVLRQASGAPPAVPGQGAVSTFRANPSMSSSKSSSLSKKTTTTSCSSAGSADKIAYEIKQPFKGHKIDPPSLKVETSAKELMHFFRSVILLLHRLLAHFFTESFNSRTWKLWFHPASIILIILLSHQSLGSQHFFLQIHPNLELQMRMTSTLKPN